MKKHYVKIGTMPACWGYIRTGGKRLQVGALVSIRRIGEPNWNDCYIDKIGQDGLTPLIFAYLH